MKSSPDPKRKYGLPEVAALINEIIAYWKEIARGSFTKANPNTDPTEFERAWPQALANFFLAETLCAAKALSALSEGRDN